MNTSICWCWCRNLPVWVCWWRQSAAWTFETHMFSCCRWFLLPTRRRVPFLSASFTLDELSSFMAALLWAIGGENAGGGARGGFLVCFLSSAASTDKSIRAFFYFILFFRPLCLQWLLLTTLEEKKTTGLHLSRFYGTTRVQVWLILHLCFAINM